MSSVKIEELRAKWKDHDSTNKAKNEIALSCLYYSVSDKPIKRLQLKFKDGRLFYLPYGVMPYIDFIPDQGLSIRSSGIEIKILGRNIDHLIPYIENETLLWLKESDKRIDDQSEPIYIQYIELSGYFSKPQHDAEE